MKKYTAPNMTVSKFMTENIITTSGGTGTDTQTAVESVKSQMQGNTKYASVETFVKVTL